MSNQELWTALTDLDRRERVAQALIETLPIDGLTQGDPLIDAATRNLTYAMLVSPAQSMHDKKAAHIFMELLANNPSFRFIMLPELGHGALEKIDVFARDRTMAETGRQTLQVHHAAAAELARIFVALDKPITRAGTFRQTLRAILKAGRGCDDGADAAAKWAWTKR